MTHRVPLAFNTFAEEELAAVERVMRSGFLTQGREVEAFEGQLAEQVGCRHAIAVNSGSSANLVGIEALVYCSQLRPDVVGGPIRPGDEVIIQGLNWPSTLKPILNQQLKPIFCDIDRESLNASIDTVDRVRTARTRMVIAVPVLGNPEGLVELRTYCRAHNLVLFEDACESLGARTATDEQVGTIGIASAFSFYFSHHISMIEGGAILTNSAEVADLCYALRSHGWTRHLKLRELVFDFDASAVDPRFCFVLPGYNVRTTEIAGAIGQVQLRRLPGMLESRRRIAQGRIEALSGLQDRVTIPGSAITSRHSWMTLPLLFHDRAHRERGQAFLEAAGVETRPIIAGNILRHPLAAVIGLDPAQPPLPVCEDIFERGLMIGLNPFSDRASETFVHETLRAAAQA